jgi:uncharacterized membrane protein YgcG
MILLILAIIIMAFIYNYDIYIVEKNQPICKPIYVTKKILTPEETEVLVENGVGKTTETMDLIDDEIIEGFNSLMGQPLNINKTTGNDYDGNLTTPGQTLATFTVSGVTDKKKIKVMDSVIKVLSNIPTNLDVGIVKQMVEYFGMIYQTSPSLSVFYQNVTSSTKIKESPYNTKYAQLVLFLIGKFNNDVEDCVEIPKNECGLIITNPTNHSSNNSNNSGSSGSSSSGSGSSGSASSGSSSSGSGSSGSSSSGTNNVPKYLQESENSSLKPEIINKLIPEIINKIVPEVRDEVTAEIKQLYPSNNSNDSNNPNKSEESSEKQNIISGIINKLIPDSIKSCKSCSSNQPDYPKSSPVLFPGSYIHSVTPNQIDYPNDYLSNPSQKPGYPNSSSNNYPDYLLRPTQDDDLNRYRSQSTISEPRCKNKCGVRCPVKKEPFGTLDVPYNSSTDYYSLLN